jgi:nitrogen regulatory protein PII
VGTDPDRIGLVLDYRGDQPPIELFEALRRYGWFTPAPHAPPAKAIDWDRPDREAGRRWTLRPYLVSGALAVPGPPAAEWATTRTWLEDILDGFGLILADGQVEVGSLREPRQGLVDMVFDDAHAAIDPFEPAERRLSALPVVDPEPPTEAHVQARGAAPLVWTAPDPVLHQRTVTAVVRRGVVDAVVEVLEEMGLEEGAVLVPVAGYGRGGGRVIRYRGRESIEPLHRVQLRVAVDPALVETTVARLTEVSRVGEKGDGKIWVT